MKPLINTNLLPLFCELMQEVVDKGSLQKTFNELSQRELNTLSKEIAKAELSIAGVAKNTLRDYQLMCKRPQNHSLKVSSAKLDILCQYVDWNKNVFSDERHINSNGEVKLLITQDFFEDNVPHVAKRLLRRYVLIMEEYEITNLDVLINSDAAPNSISEARSLALKYHADFVVWGEIVSPTQINYRLLLCGPQYYGLEKVSSPQLSSSQPMVTLADLCEGTALVKPEYLLFLVMGYLAYTQKKDTNAKRQWQKVLELDSNLGDAHFYLGVLSHLEGDMDMAIQHYQSAMDMEYLGTDLDKKTRLNYALALIGTSNKANYQKAINVLKSQSDEEHALSKNKYALLFQIYQLLADTRNATEAIKKWNNPDLSNYQRKYGSITDKLSTLDEKGYLVIVGNQEVSILPHGQPALQSITVLYSNDKIMSSTENSKLVLISITNGTIYSLLVGSKPESVRSILKPYAEFQVVRYDSFVRFEEFNSWILLEQGVFIPLKPYESHPDDQILIQFDYLGQSVNNLLSLDNGKIKLTREDIYINTTGDEILDIENIENIKIIAYNEYTESFYTLYQVPGFGHILWEHLRDVVLRFQSFHNTLPSDRLKAKTIAFVYQVFGIIPEEYLMKDRSAGT